MVNRLLYGMRCREHAPFPHTFACLRGTQPEAFRFEDPMFEKDYEMFKAYANSKLALLMFAEELQHRLDREKSKVIVNSVTPGMYSR